MKQAIDRATGALRNGGGEGIDSGALQKRVTQDIQPYSLRAAHMLTTPRIEGQARIVPRDGSVQALGEPEGPQVSTLTVDDSRGKDLGWISLRILRSTEAMVRERQGRPALLALTALSQHLAAVPGRKSVVYFSEGLHVSENLREQLRRTIEAANRGGVTIYAVDATGLTAANRTQAQSTLFAAAIDGSRIDASAPSTATITAEQIKTFDHVIEGVHSDALEPLEQLASATGGFVISDTNDTRGPALRIAEEVVSRYEASFTPDVTSWDGSLHPVAVKVRRPGARVRARAGYFALPHGGATAIQSYEVALLAAVNDPGPLHAFPFRASPVIFRPGEATTSAAFLVEIPLSHIRVDADSSPSTTRMHVSVLAMIRNAAGEVVARLSEDVPYTTGAESAPAIRQSTLLFEKRFDVQPGSYTADVAVLDRRADAVSKEKITFEIPGATSGVALSDVSAVRRIDPAPDRTSDELFSVPGARVVPALTGCTSPDQKNSIHFFFSVYPTDLADPAAVEIELFRRGQRVGRMVTALASDGSSSLPYIASVPADSLRPGSYELLVRARHGGSTAEKRHRFEFRCGEPEEPEVLLATTVPPAAVARTDPHSKEETALRVERNPDLAPAPAEIERIIATVRANALQYTHSLPDFTCMQQTRRYIASTGQGTAWKPRDVLDEAIHFERGSEKYTPLTRDPDAVRRHRLGIRSRGEFGTLLRAVMRPEAEAQIAWKDWTVVEGERLMRFTYRVAADKSAYTMTYTYPDRPGTVYSTPPISGELLVDEATLQIRRVTLRAEQLPADFPIQQSELEVRYENVTLGERDYLVPTTASLNLREGEKRLVRNEITFFGYRRFEARSAIRYEF